MFPAPKEWTYPQPRGRDLHFLLWNSGTFPVGFGRSRVQTTPMALQHTLDRHSPLHQSQSNAITKFWLDAGVDVAVVREYDGVFAAARDLRHSPRAQLLHESEDRLVRVAALVVPARGLTRVCLERVYLSSDRSGTIHRSNALSRARVYVGSSAHARSSQNTRHSFSTRSINPTPDTRGEDRHESSKAQPPVYETRSQTPTEFSTEFPTEFSTEFSTDVSRRRWLVRELLWVAETKLTLVVASAHVRLTLAREHGRVTCKTGRDARRFSSTRFGRWRVPNESHVCPLSL